MKFSNWPILSVGDYADLFWEETRTLSMRWEDGKLERSTHHADCGAGLRYLIGAESRYAAADSPNPQDIEGLAKQLWGGRLPDPVRHIQPAYATETRAAMARLSPRDILATGKAKLLETCHRAA